MFYEKRHYLQASPKVFSAGLDIMEMYKPDLKRVEEFWTTLQEVWFKLFGSNFITAAAINVNRPYICLYELVYRKHTKIHIKKNYVSQNKNK